MKRRRRRDPDEKRKRPYERYASAKMGKLALRRLARQSIGRPAVAQGPLHDALLETYGSQYQNELDHAERWADKQGRSEAVVFDIGSLRLVHWNYPLFQSHMYRDDLEGRLNRRNTWSGPYVITYVAHRKPSKSGKPGRRKWQP